MEKTIIISFNGDKPVSDFIKDEYEVLVNKTANGLEHYHFMLKTAEVKYGESEAHGS